MLAPAALALLATIGAPTLMPQAGHGVAHVLFEAARRDPDHSAYRSLRRIGETYLDRCCPPNRTTHTLCLMWALLWYSSLCPALCAAHRAYRAGACCGDTRCGRAPYLERHSLSTPVLALEQVRAEIVWIGRIINQMTVNLSEIFGGVRRRPGNPHLAARDRR